MKVIKASKFVVTLLVILFTVSLSSCSFRTTTHRSNYKAKRFRQDTQKKKLTNKSAKHYAPGHNKDKKRPIQI
jgi:cytochrome c biogenesis protein ResB